LALERPIENWQDSRERKVRMTRTSAAQNIANSLRCNRLSRKQRP